MFKNDDEAAGYLGALIDGEGSVSFRPIPRGHDRRITIYNSDESILAAAKAALEQLGITYRYYRVVRKTQRENPKVCSNVEWMGHIVIARKQALELIQARVPMRAAVKIETLDRAISTYVGRWNEHQ